MNIQERQHFASLKQGDPEWLYARAGRLTASRVADALSFLKRGDKKGESSAKRNDYVMQVATEIMRGEYIDNAYVSPQMQWGIDTEKEARTVYELDSDEPVRTVGLLIHPTIDRLAASPDALVGKHGGTEFKCPDSKTHFAWISEGIVPPEHLYQCHTGIICSDLLFDEQIEWWDFMSYDPRLDRRYQKFLRRVYRDENVKAEIEDGALLFLEDVAKVLKRLEECCPALPEKPVKVDLMDEAYLSDAEIEAIIAEQNAKSEEG